MFTAGIQDLDEAQQMQSKNKLRESGTSSPGKKLLTRSNTYILHECFHVTHFAGCPVLFCKDTFYPDIEVKSIYLQDTRRILTDHFFQEEHGWVLQGVVSRASFRRAAASGQSPFYHCTSTMSLPRKKVLPRKSYKPCVLL